MVVVVNAAVAVFVVQYAYDLVVVVADTYAAALLLLLLFLLILLCKDYQML